MIVSSAPDVADWAFLLGLLVLDESQPGLNSAAERGSEWAVSEGLRWVVIPSDLPLVSPADLSPIAAAVDSGSDVIAPSSDGGTSALSSRSAFRFGYGPGSFHGHISRLDEPEIVVSTGLLQDLDSVDDLVAAAQHPRGQWLRPLVP